MLKGNLDSELIYFENAFLFLFVFRFSYVLIFKSPIIKVLALALSTIFSGKFSLKIPKLIGFIIFHHSISLVDSKVSFTFFRT